MNYKVLVESSVLYSFADEKSFDIVNEALIICGKKTNVSINEIIKIKPQDTVSLELNLVNNKPVEFFEVGGNFFLSEKIKNIFESCNVSAEYFPTQIILKNNIYEELYFLFNPLEIINCINLDDSIYHAEYDDWSKNTDVSNFTVLVIDDANIAPKKDLFIAEGKNKKITRTLTDIILVSNKLADKLELSTLRGLTLYSINEYRYDWKWK